MRKILAAVALTTATLTITAPTAAADFNDGAALDTTNVSSAFAATCDDRQMHTTVWGPRSNLPDCTQPDPVADATETLGLRVAGITAGGAVLFVVAIRRDRKH